MLLILNLEQKRKRPIYFHVSGVTSCLIPHSLNQGMIFLSVCALSFGIDRAYVDRIMVTLDGTLIISGFSKVFVQMGENQRVQFCAVRTLQYRPQCWPVTRAQFTELPQVFPQGSIVRSLLFTGHLMEALHLIRILVVVTLILICLTLSWLVVLELVILI